MTVEQVRALVAAQSAASLNSVNDHRMTLGDSLVEPGMITVIARDVQDGRVKEENLNAWLVGQENRAEGYKIVLREDGAAFGLATQGIPNDEFPSLVGWYGNLLTTFLSI